MQRTAGGPLHLAADLGAGAHDQPGDVGEDVGLDGLLQARPERALDGVVRAAPQRLAGHAHLLALCVPYILPGVSLPTARRGHSGAGRTV